MNSGKAAEIAEQYIAAWNETDDARRNALLAQCWADNGVYVDPNVEVTGREALSRRIKEVQDGRPGAYLEFMSGTDAHHNVLRFLWRLVRADGTCGVPRPATGKTAVLIFAMRPSRDLLTRCSGA